MCTKFLRGETRHNKPYRFLTTYQTQTARCAVGEIILGNGGKNHCWCAYQVSLWRELAQQTVQDHHPTPRELPSHTGLVGLPLGRSPTPTRGTPPPFYQRQLPPTSWQSVNLSLHPFWLCLKGTPTSKPKMQGLVVRLAFRPRIGQ